MTVQSRLPSSQPASRTRAAARLRARSRESASRQRSSEGGKCVADVAQRGRPEEGVDDRVQEDVAVGVRVLAELARHLDAAEQEGAAGNEAVEVPALADAERIGRGHGALRSSLAREVARIGHLAVLRLAGDRGDGPDVAVPELGVVRAVQALGGGPPWAASRVPSRKPWGVWAPPKEERGGWPVTMPSGPELLGRVDEGQDRARRPRLGAAAATRAASSALAQGRAPSWTRTMKLVDGFGALRFRGVADAPRISRAPRGRGAPSRGGYLPPGDDREAAGPECARAREALARIGRRAARPRGRAER